MTRTRKATMIAVGIAAATGLTMAPAASAAGVGGVAGTGTITPGLTTTAQNQSFTFSGTLVYGGTPGAGTYNCTVHGSSSAPETVATGGGSASGSCSGSAGSFSFGGGYTRAGGAVTVTGAASGTVSGKVTCALGFAATSAPTVKSYAVAGSCAVS